MDSENILINNKNNKNYWKKDLKTKSTLSYKDGFFVLELHGNPYERGFAHASLLKEQIEKSDICAYYGEFLKDLFNSSDISTKIPSWSQKHIKNILEWFYYSPLEKMCIPETRDEMYGICDAMGWKDNKKKQALRATFAPDIMEHFAAGHMKGAKETLGSYYLGGCSGAYARGKAVRGNSCAFFARNMDFPGVFHWVNPTVIFAYPSEKLTRLENGKMKETEEIKQPYLYVTTAGFPGNGLTGLNSSGIAMATFVCVSKNCSRKGMSKLDFNHYLFTRAKNIDEISSMIDDSDLKCMSPHAIVFADGKKAISVEVDSTHKSIRHSPGYDIHIQTNHFLNPSFKKKELEFPLEKDFTLGRYLLIEAALEENYGYLDLQKMVDLISCNLNLNQKDTGLVGDFPAQFNTLTSVVFKLQGEAGNDFNSKKNELWVASGKPPAVCYNPYYKFAFNEKFSWDKKNWGRVIRSSRPVIGNTKLTPINNKMKESLIHFSLSQEELKQGKLGSAMANIRKARELHDDPAYKYIEAILNLRDGGVNVSLKQFTDLKKDYSFGPTKDSALELWIARCYDVLGNRKEAIEYYKKILDKSKLSKHLKKAARSSINKPFILAEMPKSIEYFLMGPLEFC